MAVTTVTGPFVYLPFRHLLWTYTLCIARQFYWSDSHPDIPYQTHSLTVFNRLNRAAVLPTFPVGPGLFIRSAVIAFLTCVSSEVAHIAFTSFFVEDPFPSGKTISDKSSDPNGTLVTGLRSTKAPLTQVSSASILGARAPELLLMSASVPGFLGTRLPRHIAPGQEALHLCRCGPKLAKHVGAGSRRMLATCQRSGDQVDRAPDASGPGVHTGPACFTNPSYHCSRPTPNPNGPRQRPALQTIS